MTTNDNILVPKCSKIYECKKCYFKCSYKRDYERHLNTKKHKNNEITTFDNGFYLKKPDLKNFTCEFCDKVYSDRAGLWRHNKKCNQFNSDKASNMSLENLSTDKDLIMILIKYNN